MQKIEIVPLYLYVPQVLNFSCSDQVFSPINSSFSTMGIWLMCTDWHLLLTSSTTGRKIFEVTTAAYLTEPLVFEDFLIKCVKYSEIISLGDAESLCSQNDQFCPCERRSLEAPALPAIVRIHDYLYNWKVVFMRYFGPLFPSPNKEILLLSLSLSCIKVTQNMPFFIIFKQGICELIILINRTE